MGTPRSPTRLTPVQGQRPAVLQRRAAGRAESWATLPAPAVGIREKGPVVELPERRKDNGEKPTAGGQGSGDPPRAQVKARLLRLWLDSPLMVGRAERTHQ